MLWANAAIFAVLDFLAYTDTLGFTSRDVATLVLGGPMVVLVARRHRRARGNPDTV